MDYGKLLSRTWEIIWEHKFLILLGLLVALSSSGGSSISSSGRWTLPGPDRDFGFPGPRDFRDFPGPPEWWREFRAPLIPTLLVLVLVGIALIVALALWVVSTLARGGLIEGANAVARGEESSFGQAFRVAWERGWTLLGIAVLPAIPVLFLVLLAGAGLIGYLTVSSTAAEPLGRVGPGVGALVVGLACIALPVALVLNLLRVFANRACMLEGLGVFDAYGRGFSVLGENIGSALLLFLIQVAASIVLGVVLLLPALCCVLWPVLLLVQGTAAAYFSTMWTLAWQEWVGQAAV